MRQVCALRRLISVTIALVDRALGALHWQRCIGRVSSVRVVRVHRASACFPLTGARHPACETWA